MKATSMQDNCFAITILLVLLLMHNPFPDSQLYGACPTSDEPSINLQVCSGSSPDLPLGPFQEAISDPDGTVLGADNPIISWYEDIGLSVPYIDQPLIHSGVDNCTNETVTLYAAATCVEDNSQIVAGTLFIEIFALPQPPTIVQEDSTCNYSLIIDCPDLDLVLSSNFPLSAEPGEAAGFATLWIERVVCAAEGFEVPYEACPCTSPAISSSATVSCQGSEITLLAEAEQEDGTLLWFSDPELSDTIAVGEYAYYDLYQLPGFNVYVAVSQGDSCLSEALQTPVYDQAPNYSIEIDTLYACSTDKAIMLEADVSGASVNSREWTYFHPDLGPLFLGNSSFLDLGQHLDVLPLDTLISIELNLLFVCNYGSYSAGATAYVQINSMIPDGSCDCLGTPPEYWYADQDGDGLGDPNTFIQSCDQPPGYVDNNLDTEITPLSLGFVSIPEIRIFPNPSAGNTLFLIIDNSEAKTANLSLFNTKGQTIDIRQLAILPNRKNHLELDLTDIPSGILYLSFEIGDQRLGQTVWVK